MRGLTVLFILLCLPNLCLPNAALAQPRLSWPIDCVAPVRCVIQNYVDTDPSPGMQDYRCAGAGFEGHKGVDIRLAHLAAMEVGVQVLAAADGIVRGVRDGERDLVPGERPVSGERDCGNGVAIDHGEGWVTQYCHLRRGSVRVETAQPVVAGQPLGLVGMSGFTEFPHVHMQLMQGGTTVDPFTGRTPTRDGCGAPTTGGLWAESVPAEALAWRERHVFVTGFAPMAVGAELLDAGLIQLPSATSEALVAYARILHLYQGDVVYLRVNGPEGWRPVAQQSEPMDRFKAQYNIFAGRRLVEKRWPVGDYSATLEVRREGRVLVSRSWTYRLSD